MNQLNKGGGAANGQGQGGVGPYDIMPYNNNAAANPNYPGSITDWQGNSSVPDIGGGNSSFMDVLMNMSGLGSPTPIYGPVQ